MAKKISKVIKLQEIIDGNDGLIQVAEVKKHIPFNVKRVYFISHMGYHSIRGFHAHKKLKQAIFCLRGNFEIEMYDGKWNGSNVLIRGEGILIPPMIWHVMRNFSDDCFIGVFASSVYKESDYIRNFHDFKRMLK